MYVYKQTEKTSFHGLWTVGYYEDQEWMPESDHSSAEEAADRVSYLNGGSREITKKDIEDAIITLKLANFRSLLDDDMKKQIIELL